MAYTIRLERADPVSLDEWKRVIASRRAVRLQIDGSSITNPTTGEVIRMGLVDGDAEAHLNGSWQACFRWRRSGQVAFAASPDFDSPESPLRRLALELAASLGARVVGEEGEEYA